MLVPWASGRHNVMRVLYILNNMTLFASFLQGRAVSAYDDKFTICDSETFGTPNPNDCAQAMFWIPYINAPASQSPDAKALRVFSEPQYQDPPFKEIIKTQKYAPRGIEQVPKVWKYRKCGTIDVRCAGPMDQRQLTKHCCFQDPARWL